MILILNQFGMSKSIWIQLDQFNLKQIDMTVSI